MAENEVTEEQQAQTESQGLSQEEVNRIVQREKAQAAERARREAEAQYQQQLEQLQQQAQAQQSSGQQAQEAQTQGGEGQGQQADPEALYQQIQERFNNDLQQRQLEQEINNVAQNYLTKVDQARQNYKDFDEITANFDPGAFPQLVYLMSGLDNAGDIVYDLAQNPQKLVTLDTLAQRAPKAAQAELAKLGQSIQTNRQAKLEAEEQDTEAPLDRLQPTRHSTGSSGQMGINDLRQQPWLRG